MSNGKSVIPILTVLEVRSEFYHDSEMAKHTRQKDELDRLQGQLERAHEDLKQEKTKYDVVRADMKKVRKTNVEYQRQLRELQKVRAKQDEDYAELLSK